MYIPGSTQGRPHQILQTCPVCRVLPWLDRPRHYIGSGGEDPEVEGSDKVSVTEAPLSVTAAPLSVTAVIVVGVSP